jgi:hypothetical protein
MPYPGFWSSARALDQKRLGQQRVAIVQVLRTARAVSTPDDAGPPPGRSNDRIM